MPWRKITIECDSDCETCTARRRDEFQMLAEVRVAVLEDLTCQECGRTIAILIEAEPAPEFQP